MHIFNRHVLQSLGFGRPYITVVSSFVLALTSFFYIYAISSYFKISTYILENRVIYIDYFDKYVINKFTDYVIIDVGIIAWILLSFRGKARFYISALYGAAALISLFANLSIITDIITLISVPLAIFFLIYNKFTFNKILGVSSDLAVNYISIIATIIGVISIVKFLPSLFSSPSTTIPVPNFTYDIFSLFSGLSSILMFLLIFSLPLKMLINTFTERSLKVKYDNTATISLTDIVRRRNKILYLMLIILLSIILVLIPHQPAINKEGQAIGVDTHYYVNWVGNLTNTDNVQEFFRQAFVVQAGGDRPLALIFLLTVVEIINVNPFYTIEYIPIILGPGLIVVVYFLTRELTSNDITSLLAAFLTALSFHTLVGIYAGFYANWLALIIGYLSAVFLLRFLRESKKLDYVLYSVLSVFSLLTHVYTWSILVIVFAIFLVVMLKTKYYPRRNIILLLMVIAFSFSIAVAMSMITGSTGGIARDIEVAAEKAGPEFFNQRWVILTEAIHIYDGGQLSNFIILGLGLYWLFLFNFRKISNIFIIIFLSTGILPLFFGDSGLQTRIFYNIPFQIPAAIALADLNRHPNVRVLVVPICIWLIAVSFIAVSNFYFIPSPP